MPCPHSKRADANPDTCSQCRGAPARRVTIDERGRVLVDGKPTGRLANPDPPWKFGQLKGR